jgi:hypothetical protein
LDVLVQLVMAANTSEPSFNVGCAATPFDALAPGFFALVSEGRAAVNDDFTCASSTRSCGRRGPARQGAMLPMSNSTTCVYSASGVSGPANMPCSRK